VVALGAGGLLADGTPTSAWPPPPALYVGPFATYASCNEAMLADPEAIGRRVFRAPAPAVSGYYYPVPFD